MDFTGSRVFFWGQMFEGATARARMLALRELGCLVTAGDNAEILRGAGRLSFYLARRLGLGPLVEAENRALLAAVDQPFDLIWIDKAAFLRPATLAALRRWAPRLVHFTPDPMFPPGKRMPLFQHCIPLFDLHATTKPQEVPMYQREGSRGVVLCSKSYDPALHRTYPAHELEPFRADVTFVGSWTSFKEAEVVRLLEAVPEASVRVWGPRWRERAGNPLLGLRLGVIPGGLFGPDYGRALAAAKVGLGLMAWDLAPEEVITDRILEIPACGSLLVAPRTEAIANLFRDGEEALLYGSSEEMVSHVKWALAHEADRAAIARQGTARVKAGPFRNVDVVRGVMEAAYQ
jgi:hypothetical protein